MHRIRVLVVDDHAILRDGICSLLALNDDIEVVGQAENGKQALQLVASTHPNVVLMDIAMPEMDGLQATRQIIGSYPTVHVLVLTQYDDNSYISSLLEAGACGYVLKRSGGEEIINAIRSVHHQGAYLSADVAREVVAQRRAGTRSKRPKDAGGLTRRELEVLALIVEGLSSREVAERLCIAHKTAMVHRSNIMRKLGVHKSTELVSYAIREGLV